MAQAVEVKVNHRGGVKRQDLAEHQPADDRHAQRLAHLRAFGTAEQQRQGPEDGRQGGHQDRPQAQQAGTANRLQRRQAILAFQLQGQVDHQDGVFLHHANQQEQPEQ
ncbi:hypothetical protein D3C85_1012490 [compost metagenome]